MTKKYEATSDIMAEVDAPAEMEVQAHYGELQWIFRIEVPQSPQLCLDKPQTLCLAAIKDCDTSYSKDGFWEFKTAGKLTIIDLSTIQCVVGQIYYRGKLSLTKAEIWPISTLETVVRSCVGTLQGKHSVVHLKMCMYCM